MSEQTFQNQQMIFSKSKGATAVLCFLLGGSIDFVEILCGSFTDKEGAVIK